MGRLRGQQGRGGMAGMQIGFEFCHVCQRPMHRTPASQPAYQILKASL